MKTPISKLLCDYCNGRVSSWRSVQVWDTNIDTYHPVLTFSLAEGQRLETSYEPNRIHLTQTNGNAEAFILISDDEGYDILPKDSREGIIISLVNLKMLIKIEITNY